MAVYPRHKQAHFKGSWGGNGEFQCAFHILTLEAGCSHLEVVTNSILLSVSTLFAIPGFSFSFTFLLSYPMQPERCFVLD